MHQLLSQAVAIYFEVFVVQRFNLSESLYIRSDLYPRPSKMKSMTLFHIRSFPCHLVLLLKKKISVHGSQGDQIQIALWVTWVNRCDPSFNLATTGSYSLISYTHVAAFKSNLRSPIWFLVFHCSSTCIYCIPHSFVHYLYTSHASRIHMMVYLCEWYTIEDCIIHYAGLEPMCVHCDVDTDHSHLTSTHYPQYRSSLYLL